MDALRDVVGDRHLITQPDKQAPYCTGFRFGSGSAIAAVSLQWYTKLRFYSQQNSGVLIGATILKKDKFDALSAEHQTALMETSEHAHRLLARAIRREDDRSLRVLDRRLTAVDQSAHEAENRSGGARELAR